MKNWLISIAVIGGLYAIILFFAFLFCKYPVAVLVGAMVWSFVALVISFKKHLDDENGGKRR